MAGLLSSKRLLTWPKLVPVRYLRRHGVCYSLNNRMEMVNQFNFNRLYSIQKGSY